MSMRPRQENTIPVETVRVARAAFPKGSLPIRVRDQLEAVFADEAFAAAFGSRGPRSEAPGVLALVTALQFVEDLTDRQAQAMLARAIDWKYAAGLTLDDPGFDFTVLSKFRTRLVAHGLERACFDRMIDQLKDAGLLGKGGAQRSDSTHVISAVRDLNRTELAGESVRAALEALAVTAPAWLAQTVDLAEFDQRYGRRIDTWRGPSSRAKKARLALVYGQDAYRLLRAACAPGAPIWLRDIEAVEILRQVLLQNYYVRTDTRGREVITQRAADDQGLPPARHRLTSPYETDSRWAAKGDDLFWNGYKVHLTETCHPPDTAIDTESGDTPTGPGRTRPKRPNLITDVYTTDATVPDVKATRVIHSHLNEHDLLPTEHYLDSGYPSAKVITAAAEDQITLVTPALIDTSPQARAAEGFEQAAFNIDWVARQATCPAEKTSTNWSRATQHGREVIVVKFGADACDSCLLQAKCTTSSRGRRQLTLHPQALHQALSTARARQETKDWKEKYKLRAGVEGTIHQAIAVTGIRRARYRGKPKVELQHAFSAIAINLTRLDAWWTGHPLDRGHASNLTRLHHTLAA